jgi:flagellar assembly protein FliH
VVEETILLSKLIKSDFYISLTQLKLIETTIITNSSNFSENEVEGSQLSEADQEELNLIHSTKSRILQDAEEIAEKQVSQAMSDADDLRQRALLEIEQWWQERRDEDDTVTANARNEGYEAGYQQGIQEAEAFIKASYADMINESQATLDQAYRLKEQIIQESEPFLIELSCAIAEKVIQRQLNLSPEWVIEYTQGILSRRREKGLISICVAPKQFSFMQDAKDEFMLHIDSQAELQILPDATVSDHGCVIRSPFLSVDARIDTQLKEIKNALQLIAKRNESALDHE